MYSKWTSHNIQPALCQTECFSIAELYNNFRFCCELSLFSGDIWGIKEVSIMVFKSKPLTIIGAIQRFPQSWWRVHNYLLILLLMYKSLIQEESNNIKDLCFSETQAFSLSISVKNALDLITLFCSGKWFCTFPWDFFLWFAIDSLIFKLTTDAIFYSLSSGKTNP